MQHQTKATLVPAHFAPPVSYEHPQPDHIPALHMQCDAEQLPEHFIATGLWKLARTITERQQYAALAHCN